MLEFLLFYLFVMFGWFFFNRQSAFRWVPSTFDDFVDLIYPNELEIKVTTYTARSVSYNSKLRVNAG